MRMNIDYTVYFEACIGTMRRRNNRADISGLSLLITCLFSTTMDGISSEHQTRYTNEIPSIATSHCHTLENGPHECPIRQFAALEIPKVPDVLQTVLSTAFPLDDTVRHSLLTGLEATRSVSDDIDRCMSAMQAILEQMQSAKDSCTLSIKRYETAIHPIRSLPDDILLAIFHWHIILESATCIRYNAISVDRSPWTLSRVSRRWRALALSSPLLWRDVRVHSSVIAESRINSDVMVHRLNLLLERSADCDLGIVIIGTDTTHDALLAEIVHLLMPTTSRWKSVEIVLTSISILAPWPTSSFERLTDLIWRCAPHDPDSDPDEPRVFSSMFKSALNIRRLVLEGPIKVDLQWERIREYTCDFHGIQFLRNLTSLDRLILDFTPREDMPSSSIPYMRQISQLLHIPSLTTLVIDSEKAAFRSPLPLLVLELLLVAEGDTVLLPNLTGLHIGAKLLMIDAGTVLCVLESRCGDHRPGDVAHLVELFILGSEATWRRVETLIKRRTAVWKRWTALSAKINVFRTDNTVW